MAASITESSKLATSLILVTGPTRSGKSDWAEQLATQTQQPVCYIATAQENPKDLEWQARIQAHRDRRPPHWQIQEVPQDLTLALTQASPPTCLLIDSLGTWVANTLDQTHDEWQQTQRAFLNLLHSPPCTMIFVAEEVGWGVVPAYPAGRLFCDRLGTLVRHTGQLANELYLVVAGYAVDLKRVGHTVNGPNPKGPTPKDIK